MGELCLDRIPNAGTEDGTEDVLLGPSQSTPVHSTTRASVPVAVPCPSPAIAARIVALVVAELIIDWFG